MLNKTHGIVIKTTKFSETSLIALIYTKSHGMLSFMVPGVYSRKANIKPSLLQPLLLLDMNFYYKENRNLNKLKEIKAEPVLKDIHFNIQKSSIVLVVSELLFKTIKEEEANEELFDFLVSSIQLLDDTQNRNKIYLIVFMIQLSKYLGFYPTNNYDDHHKYFDLEKGKFISEPENKSTTIEPSDSEFFGSIIDLNIDCIDEFKSYGRIRRNIINKLITYYQIHVSNFGILNSYKVLSQVFNQ